MKHVSDESHVAPKIASVPWHISGWLIHNNELPIQETHITSQTHT